MKHYLVGMSGPGSLEDLRELIEPVREHFDGVVWVLHDGRDSTEEAYLESVKGAGRVIPAIYARRHDVSRNLGLWCGPMQEGDWAMDVDVLERIAPAFAASFRSLTGQLAARGLNAAHYYGKHFIFQHHESLRYQGNPHEGLTRDDGQLRGIELSQFYPDEKKVRYGVRNEKRDALHWLWHYGKYYISTPWGGNHCLLGNSDRGDEIAIYREREKTRLEFRAYLRSKGVPLTVEAFRDYLLANPQDPEIIRLCNLDKITNDLYRHIVLKDPTINDNHHWRDLLAIPLTSPLIPPTIDP